MFGTARGSFSPPSAAVRAALDQSRMKLLYIAPERLASLGAVAFLRVLRER